MFLVTNLVCSCCLLLIDTWSLLISLSLAHHLSEGAQLEFKPSKILNMYKTYCSPLQTFRVSQITQGTRCYVISKLGTDFISHWGRASSYHLSCFWNPSFPVQTAPITFLSLLKLNFCYSITGLAGICGNGKRATSIKERTRPTLSSWASTAVILIVLKLMK